jgi:SAM-dependent methyltransferase
MDDPADAPHSAAYFGDERDLWWNADYVDLLARRFGLARVERVLDVGAGLGHWGLLLATVVSPGAIIVGLERDSRWVAQATERANAQGLEARLRYRQGVAEQLPFADDSFDLVTCQTLLIHVQDPAAVISEMVRVAGPGGLVLVAEPNNRASLLVETNLSAAMDVDRKTETVRFGLMLERGKQLLGEGYSSVGDLVPGLFAAAGLLDVQAYVADKAALLVPPYAGEGQQVLKDAWIENARAGFWTMDRADAERYFAAAGGDPGDFARSWERRLEEDRAAAAALEANSLDSAGGVIHYVVAGRKAHAPY